ncbi:hypothetical protein Palpr_0506 [Paludibacter propionicigenes WB4]|uniref:Uncharacterized protein n=1 Tax=Paludibacter propionicigenes (strain DSM 17365 / JCM 13257 / WB4) TaxID=694427 RepID=E4T1S1_PALPW|nr:hypothetical protein [Paludibacter propionicigenes]ADQ78665.1 hypothetical protein Palpr_0506 [Paludibacter propionicigenes WB4]
MKSKVLAAYPHFQVEEHACNLFIADYTSQIENQREVEIHTTKPTDIDSFEIRNPTPIQTCSVKFDNNSFQDTDGKPLTQCECVSFPNVPVVNKPWLLFLELKYCQQPKKQRNLNKAKSQLFATMAYFKEKGIIADQQPCYLIASLPLLNKPPFESFILMPSELQKLKREENIIIKGTNAITIKNEFLIQV